MEHFLYQATVYLATAVLAVPIAARLGLGSVLGYLAAGILVGPVLGLVGSETEELQHVAEFGVVMMLFLIGLELDPRTLWNMRTKLMGLGGPQVVLTALALMVAAIAFGQGWAPFTLNGICYDPGGIPSCHLHTEPGVHDWQLNITFNF